MLIKVTRASLTGYAFVSFHYLLKIGVERVTDAIGNLVVAVIVYDFLDFCDAAVASSAHARLAGLEIEGESFIDGDFLLAMAFACVRSTR